MTPELTSVVGQACVREDSEQALWLAFKGGEGAAREKLFSLHYPFARKVASREFMKRRGGDIEFPEFCQMASLGLLEAIDRFDPGHGAPFGAYATHRITGAIRDGLGKLSEVREQVSFRRRTQRDRVDSLQSNSAKDPLDALVELAVGLALGFMLEGTTLYVEQDEISQQPNAYESMAWKEAMQKLAKAVEGLPEREQTILRRHYFDGLRFEEIGAVVGVTKGRISQIHKAALGLLRKRLSQTNSFTLKR